MPYVVPALDISSRATSVLNLCAVHLAKIDVLRFFSGGLRVTRAVTDTQPV